MKIEYPHCEQERELLATNCEYFLSNQDYLPQDSISLRNLANLDFPLEVSRLEFPTLESVNQFILQNKTFIRDYPTEIRYGFDGKHFLEF